MQTVAIIALIISFISLTVAIISCVIAVKNYKKSRRLEFFQRRDQLFLKISDLNAKNSEAHLMSARYDIVLLNKESLKFDGKDAEKNRAQIASIKKLQADTELIANHWDESIKRAHSICSSLTETDSPKIEKMTALVQGALNDAKKYNEISLASLHTFENLYPMEKDSIAEMNELKEQLHDLKIRRAELDLEAVIREIRRNEKAPD